MTLSSDVYNIYSSLKMTMIVAGTGTHNLHDLAIQNLTGHIIYTI